MTLRSRSWVIDFNRCSGKAQVRRATLSCDSSYLLCYFLHYLFSLKLPLQIDQSIKSKNSPAAGDQPLSIVKTVTLSEPETVKLLGPMVPSPERKSNRQNVAIQVIYTVTLSELETVKLLGTVVPSPERKSNRQNVAVQVNFWHQSAI